MKMQRIPKKKIKEHFFLLDIIVSYLRTNQVIEMFVNYLMLN